ncbi:hypothetical protein EKK97_13870 [Billgrantia tianxiuensis]|uniref:Uncharacterized protein n=1 Tax=Billgrantia tianxiuensis TaxID=2497861 RepID=A0A6I6SLI3_9GAMM|nr:MULTISPECIES: hypothetical protein [Halomonas]MCE8034585.1 hypothetical protein [Halomonas sp. MCCC 1A11057]QHC50452.1 hypothetical protein EKK97_13870 [Halomonas tianxiuensis]
MLMIWLVLLAWVAGPRPLELKPPAAARAQSLPGRYEPPPSQEGNIEAPQLPRLGAVWTQAQ